MEANSDTATRCRAQHPSKSRAPLAPHPSACFACVVVNDLQHSASTPYHMMRVRVLCCPYPCSWQGTTMWARLEVENTGRQKAMVLIDIKGEPKVRSCSSMFNKEFGSSDPGPVGEPFFATGHFFFWWPKPPSQSRWARKSLCVLVVNLSRERESANLEK